jgi:solute carrier family 13 (sodium-dependent dicarboxylate transporter), member 2/3/5
MWITDMAVAAMLMPLARAILIEEGCKPKESNFGKALMIAVAWGALVGGIGTPAGTGANPIALQFLANMAGIRLSFLDWMVYGVPSAILILPVAWAVLMLVLPAGDEAPEGEQGAAQGRAQGHASHEPRGEDNALRIRRNHTHLDSHPFIEGPLGMVIEISLPALLAACLFFMPGMSKAKWKDIEGEIDWAGILLIVSGIALGTYLYKTGVAEWLAITLLGRIGEVPLFAQLFLVTLGVCLLKVVFSSNSVTATILIPLIIGLGQGYGHRRHGHNPGRGLTTSLAFILVTTTPRTSYPSTPATSASRTWPRQASCSPWGRRCNRTACERPFWNNFAVCIVVSSYNNNIYHDIYYVNVLNSLVF